MATDAAFNYSFGAKDQATMVFQNIGKEFSRLAKNSKTASKVISAAFGGFMGGVISMKMGMKGLKGALDFADTAGKFQQTMVMVGETANASSESLKKLRDTAIDVSLRTKFDPKGIGEGMQTIAELGLQTVDILKAIEPATLLATAGSIKLDKAAKGLVGTMRAFEIPLSKAAEVTDKFVFMAKNSAFQIRDIDRGLNRSAIAMGIYGQSLEETLVLTGALMNTNLKANVASTGLRSAVTRVSASKKVMNNLSKIGVEIMNKEKTAMRPLSRILLDMRVGMDKMNVAQKSQFISQNLAVRGMMGYAGAMRLGRFVTEDNERVWVSGAKAFKSLLDEMDRSKGTAKSYSDAMLNTFEGQKQLLEGVASGFKVELGTAIADVLKPVLLGVVGVFQTITKAIQGLNPETKKLIGIVWLGASAFSAIAGTAVVATVAVGALILAFTTLSSVMLPAVAVVGAIGAAAIATGLGLAGLATSSGVRGKSISSSLTTMWKDVKLVFDGVSQSLSGDKLIRGKTLESLVKKENKGLLGWVINITRMVDRAQKFFQGLWDGFQEGIRQNRPAFDAFKASFREFTDALGITNKEGKLFSKTQDAATAGGQSWGKTLAEVATVGIKFMSAMTVMAAVLVDNFDAIAVGAKALLAVLLAIAAVKLGRGMTSLASRRLTGGGAPPAVPPGGRGAPGSRGFSGGPIVPPGGTSQQKALTGKKVKESVGTRTGNAARKGVVGAPDAAGKAVSGYFAYDFAKGAVDKVKEGNYLGAGFDTALATMFTGAAIKGPIAKALMSVMAKAGLWGKVGVVLATYTVGMLELATATETMGVDQMVKNNLAAAYGETLDKRVTSPELLGAGGAMRRKMVRNLKEIGPAFFEVAGHDKLFKGEGGTKAAGDGGMSQQQISDIATAQKNAIVAAHQQINGSNNRTVVELSQKSTRDLASAVKGGNGANEFHANRMITSEID